MKEIKMKEIKTNEEKLKVGIGTKDTESLKAALVEIMGIEMKEVKFENKTNEKVVCLCRHPNAEKPVGISAVKVERNGKLKTVGLWFSLDEDNLIPKSSALASLLKFVGIKTIDELSGKQIETAVDNKGYLCFKAY